VTHTHTHTHTLKYTHSAGLLWTKDQPFAEMSTGQYTIFRTNNHVPCGIRTRNPSKYTCASDGATNFIGSFNNL